MDATTNAVLTGVIVTAGKWGTPKDPKNPKGPSNGFDVKLAVGVAVYAISLSVINNGYPEIAGKLSLLVLVGALLNYAIPIATNLGWYKK